MDLWIIVALFGSILAIGTADDLSRCPPHLPRNRFLKTFGEKCYQFDYEEMFWDTAVRTCRNRGGNLVTIRSEAVQKFLERTLNGFPWRRNGVWIGATDQHSERDWKWVTGERVNSGYQKWDSGQPSCFLLKVFCLEDCACLRLDEGFKWHDYPCDRPGYTYSFICEYAMEQTPPPTTPTTPATTPKTTTPTTPPSSTTESSTLSTLIIKHLLPVQDVKHDSEALAISPTNKPATAASPGPESQGNKTLPGVESQRLAADEKRLHTGGVVGIVVSFVLVFIAGLLIGVFLCRRRRKRNAEQASYSFNNVVYQAAPVRPEPAAREKNTNLKVNLAEEENTEETCDNHYTEIDDVTCSAVVALTSKDVPNDDSSTARELTSEEDGACGGSLPPDYLAPPPPCRGTINSNFAPEFLKKSSDVSQAYCNNLYEVSPKNTTDNS